MSNRNDVENADYYAEIRCEENVCEWRVRRRDFNSDKAPKTVAEGNGVHGRDAAKKEAKEAKERVRYENGWVRVFDHEIDF